MPRVNHSRRMVAVNFVPNTRRAASPAWPGWKISGGGRFSRVDNMRARFPAASSTGQPCRELPRQVDRLLDAGVHAEAARRGNLMGAAANEKDAAGAVAIGDQFAAPPWHDRNDIEIERAADRALDRDPQVGFAALAVFAA